MSFKYALGFIGAGNMAEGIVGAAVRDGLYGGHEIVVFDPVAERVKVFLDDFGVHAAECNEHLVADAARIVLAVKPQTFAAVAEGFADRVTGKQVLISIMAGMSTSRIEEAFPAIRARVVRVMPNLPIRIGAGTSGICAGQHATDEDVAEVEELFNAGGSSVVLGDESLMDAVTAVSGSGPAYFYYFVESIVAGGVASGLSEADALALAKSTCLGAARMMLESNEPPAELRRKVTSKGGTTQAALEHMSNAGVGDSIRDAVVAAFKRGRELGG